MSDINNKLDAKMHFMVQAAGFPAGKIFKLYAWFNSNNISKIKGETFIENNRKDIFKLLPEGTIVHDIKFTFIIYASTREDKEKYGTIFLDKVINIAGKDSPRPNKPAKKVAMKVVKANDVDIIKMTDDELHTLFNFTDDELFRRENDLSLDEYSFFVTNQDIIEVSDAKELYKKYGADKYALRKSKIRDIVNEKVLKEQA